MRLLSISIIHCVEFLSSIKTMSSDTPSKKASLCLSVYVLRHCETPLGLQRPRVLAGQTSTSLTENGKAQAQVIGQRLSKVKLSHIYSADSAQAVETAAEIANAQLGPVQMDSDPRLRELNLGPFTGYSWKRAKAILKARDMHLDDYLIKEKGESAKAFDDRVMDFYAQVIIMELLAAPHKALMAEAAEKLSKLALAGAKQSGKNSDTIPKPVSPAMVKMDRRSILIVTHGGWIDSLMKQLIEDLNFDVRPGVLHQGFPHTGGLYEFQIYKETSSIGANEDYDWKGAIKMMNSTSHMGNLPGQARIIAQPPSEVLRRAGSGASLSSNGGKSSQSNSPHFSRKPGRIQVHPLAGSVKSNSGSPASSTHSSPKASPSASLSGSPSASPATAAKRKTYLRMFGLTPKNFAFFSISKGKASSPIVSSPLTKAQAAAIASGSSPVGKTILPNSPQTAVASGSKGSPRGTPRIRKKSLGW